ncbi:MAG TPA: sigma-70 family RNA polymerase sigma factor [Gemmatimonadales bacterium]|nr:sigma-70 family RNA polymerase sigma factor [Gemmatimonadales bacterium]
MSIDWAAVYHTTYADLVRFLYRKIWDADQAQDLAQETFVRALDHAPENPRAWLFTVAANLARDTARSVIRRRKHLALIKSEVAADPPVAVDPSDRVESSDQLAAVRRALEQLTERDREALLLWDAGFTYQEMAAQLGLSLGSVGTTLARARRKLVEAHERIEGGHVASG